MCGCGFTLLGGGIGESGNERPGAFFGMSGWLPFEKQLNSMMNVDGIINDSDDEKEADGLDHQDSEHDGDGK